MGKIVRFMFCFGIMIIFSALATTSALAQFPDPKDEAKLYELAKKEGTVVWYGSSPLEGMKATAKDFETKYPGLKVEVLRIVGVAGYQRFVQESNAKQYIADIVHLSDVPSMDALVKQNLLAEWKIPAADRVPAAFRRGNYCYAPYSVSLAIVYNINKVTPEEVKILDTSWKGVLDPRFKGRFAVTSMKCAACYAGIHMFLDPKYAKVFGPQFIRAVAAQRPTVYSEVLVALDRVVAGEHDFTYWTWDQAAYLKWIVGAPIRWIYSDPTPEYVSSLYGISKFSPHPNGSRLFLNWLMSKEGCVSFQENGFKIVIEGIKDTRKMVGEPWHHPIKNRYDVDFDRWTKNYNQDLDFWVKTMMESK